MYYLLIQEVVAIGRNGREHEYEIDDTGTE